MKIDKEMILDLLKSQGREDDAKVAAKELPAKVDAQRDAGLLAKLGIDPEELLAKLPGGLGDKLGDQLSGLLGGKK